MFSCRNTVVVSVLLLALSACSKNTDAVTTAQNTIFTALQSQGIYQRGNLPVVNTPTPEQIKGRFDIIDGAYRYIVNEERADRGTAAEDGIRPGDRISFMFDARIYTGGTFENQQTFYTNIASRIQEITGNNADFVTDQWPTTPLEIEVGNDPGILRSLQNALTGGPEACRQGDQVRVYLTPNLAFGNKTVYDVPRNSTLVFQITDIVKIKN